MTGNPVMPSTLPQANKVNILLLGLGGNVTQGILKVLRTLHLECRLVGACVSASSAGLYMCDAAYISPYANDPSFVPWLQNVCSKEHIDIAFSGVEEVLSTIAAHRNIIEQRLKTRFIVSALPQMRIGADKLATCLWLQRNDFGYPRFAASEDTEGVKILAEQAGGRLIAKPRYGKGSHGIMHLRTPEDIRQVEKLHDYVIQEEVGFEDSEYTVGCYRSKNGDDIYTIIMRRELFSGTTAKAVVCHNTAIEKEAIALCKKFQPTGPLNIQLRLDSEGQPICFELNVRFSGTTPMRAYFGFHDVEAAIREYVFGEEISDCFSVREGIAVRYWEEIYIDGNIEKKLAASGVVEAMPKCGRLSLG